MEEIVLNDYLNGDNLICREERQFSLFLYNKLKENNEKILKDMNFTQRNERIIDVFYEPTLMRDYFHQGDKEEFKKVFNEKLMQFVLGKKKLEGYKEHIEENHANHWKLKHQYAQWMMNAKPDLAILTQSEENIKLYFCECKYKSRQTKYTYNQDNSKVSQVCLQKDSLSFLCNVIKPKYNLTGGKGEQTSIERGEVIECKFYLSDLPKKLRCEGKDMRYIKISDLIK